MSQPFEPAILQQIDSAHFSEACSELEKLQLAAATGTISPGEALSILRKARYAALAQRSQLLKSLSILEAKRLFERDTPAIVASWSLEG